MVIFQEQLYCFGTLDFSFYLRLEVPESHLTNYIERNNSFDH